MDQQTKISTGLAALFGLLALLEPHFSGSHIVLTVVIYAVFILSTALGLLPPLVRLIFQKQRTQGLRYMWPQYFMTFGCVLFFVGLVAFLQFNVVPPKQKERDTASPAAKATEHPNVSPTPPRLGALVDFSSNGLPSVAPSDGVIQMFEIREDIDGFLVTHLEKGDVHALPIKYQFGPNEIIDWRKTLHEWPIFGVAKCELTSITNEPIFDAVITLRMTFHEMVPHAGEVVEIGTVIQAVAGVAGQKKSGPVVFKKDARFDVGKISAQSPYVIYFVNRTHYLVKFEVPSTAISRDFSKPASEMNQEILLKPGRLLDSTLVPRRDVSSAQPSPK
jgi:hypothetical protein